MRSIRTVNINSGSHRQSGATLVVCLVILTVMTFLGLNAMTDSSLQTSMVRNNQLNLMAYNVSLSEINAQLDDMELNFNTGPLVDALNDSLGLREFEADEVLLAGLDHPFAQDLNIQYVFEVPCLQSGINLTSCYRYDLTSDATLDGTGTRSIQIQRFTYEAPNAN